MAPVSTPNEAQLDAEKPTTRDGNATPESDRRQEEDTEKPTRSIRGPQWFLVVLAIQLSGLLYSLDNSIVADVQPQIVATFGSVDKLPWLSVAFALGSAATTLCWSSLYASFDAKVNYAVGLVIFEIGSAICGAANSIDLLIFGRAIAGAGGAGLYVGVLTLLSALTLPGERPIYLASTGLVWGAGNVLGPVIGGGFADSSATWRWAFYINLCVAGAFIPVYLFFIPSVRPKSDTPFSQRVRELDFVGFLLSAGSFCCSVSGLSFGGSLHAWDSATIIVLLVFGAVLFGLFLLQQARPILTTSETRLLPIHYFKSRILAIVFVQAVLNAAIVFLPVYYISLLFQFTKGDTALTTAVHLLPFMCMLIFFSIFKGVVFGKEGHYLPWFLISAVLSIVGGVLMFTVDEATSTASIYGYTALLGIGAGCAVQTGFIVAQATVPRKEMSSAVTFMNFAQIAGLVLILTLANTIFLNLAIAYVGHVLPNATASQIRDAVSGTGSTFLSTLSLQTQDLVVHALVRAISRTYLLLVACGCIQLLLCQGLRWEKTFMPKD